MILRRVARPLLAWIFINNGIDTLRNPEGKVKSAQPWLDRNVGARSESLPDAVPTDAETLVKINAGVMVGAGALLGIGKFPRLSSVLLAGTLVPTTLAGHPYWEEADPQQRATQKIQFEKNLAMLGGLLIAGADTAGKPSVGWRARRAKRKARKEAAAGTESAIGSFRASLPG